MFYRYAGRQVGMTGNNGTSDVGFTQSVEERSAARPDPTAATAGLFRNGMSTGAAVYADFSLGYDPYNSMAQGSSGGSYTVNQGDTLASIAQAIYGDANLWYRIAEVNGLTANSALTDGQILTLPTGVSRTGNSAGTSKPYDPADALGELSPSTPKPPKKAKCGIVGQILSMVVAVAASYFLGPVLGNVVSQGFNNLIGLQHGFSFKSLAIAAVTAGVAKGLEGLNVFGTAASAARVASDVARGALTSAVSQGIGVATGLQKKFDWAGVAAAGVGSGISGAVSRGLASKEGLLGIHAGTNSATNANLSSTADAIAQAATRSVVEGSGFGDNLLASLPSVIGNMLGRSGVAALGDSPLGKILADIRSVTDAPVDIIASGVRTIRQSFENRGTNGQTTGQKIASAIKGSDFSDVTSASQNEPLTPLKMRKILDGVDVTDLETRLTSIPTGKAYETPAGTVIPIAESTSLAEARQMHEDGVKWAQDKLTGDAQNQAISTYDQAYQADLDRYRNAVPQYVTAEEPSFLGTLGDILMNMPIQALGYRSLSQTGRDADLTSSYLQSGLDWTLNKVEDSARYQPAGQRQTTIFIANFGHSVLSGVAQLPQAVTHPGRTLNGMAFSAAGAVDNMLNTNMNMTATQWANAQYRSARSMSSDDLARLSGKATALALPVAGGLYAKGVGGATSFTGTISEGFEAGVASRVAAEAVPAGFTRSYRAVGRAEYDDIVQTGRFSVGPNSVEGKYFADTMEGVVKHGDGLEGPGKYWIIEADLPNNAPSLYTWPNLDGHGPARFLHIDDLTGVVPKPLPKGK